jgi:hypothetical protein
MFTAVQVRCRQTVVSSRRTSKPAIKKKGG